MRSHVSVSAMRRHLEAPATDSRAAAPVRWVFLDRDGTLNEPPPTGEYVERPQQLQLLPGAAAALRLLNRAGVWTALVTNQRGVALGRMSAADLDAVHARLGELLAHGGAHLDAIYACPHGLGECDCRKPQAGMLLQAQREQPTLDFAQAAIVGDSDNDVQAGRRLGLRTVMIVPNGHGQAGAKEADQLVGDVLEAVELLLGRTQATPPGRSSG
jgi:D-glycero-D-manno-heptose 1,7-bisphosphate phosphatase